MDIEKKWYVLHVLSGHEYKVQTYVENNMKAHGLEEKIPQVLVPAEEVLGLRAGKKVKTTRKLLPGYVIVEMVMEDEVLSFLKGIPGVTNFVGSGGKPIPLKE